MGHLPGRIGVEHGRRSQPSASSVTTTRKVANSRPAIRRGVVTPVYAGW